MTHTTNGLHHLGLTIPDLDAALGFFTDALGFEQIGAVPDYPAAFISDGNVMLTLWQAEDAATATAFDRRRNLGLHHFALRVADAAALEATAERLSARDDVVVEFAPEPLGDGGARHMMQGPLSVRHPYAGLPAARSARRRREGVSGTRRAAATQRYAQQAGPFGRAISARRLRCAA